MFCSGFIVEYLHYFLAHVIAALGRHARRWEKRCVTEEALRDGQNNGCEEDYVIETLYILILLLSQ